MKARIMEQVPGYDNFSDRALLGNLSQIKKKPDLLCSNVMYQFMPMMKKCPVTCVKSILISLFIHAHNYDCFVFILIEIGISLQ